MKISPHIKLGVININGQWYVTGNGFTLTHGFDTKDDAHKWISRRTVKD